MPQLSAEAKYHILLEYAANDATRSFADLAARHAVKGGERVLRNSHQRWDGTPASLQHKRGAGRPRALNSTQVQLHVQRPIRAANRAQRAVHYTELLPVVRQRTGTNISLRSLQRYGKEELRARDKQTKKRTRAERQCNATHAAVC